MPDVAIQRTPHGYLLRAECVVPRPSDEIFAFFADATNLEELTPPWIRFSVTTSPPIEMRPGLLIDYKLRIRGVPMRWQSEITAWDPPRRFVDESRRGPYKFWHHEHRFEPTAEGTRVIDEVNYGVPGGALIHWLLVSRDIAKIFRYRQAKLSELFG